MGSPESPEGRGLKHASAASQFLLRTKAINCKLRLAPACFRSRRDAIDLLRGPLSLTIGLLHLVAEPPAGLDQCRIQFTS